MAIDDFNANVSTGSGTQAVVGLFTDGEDAQQALSELREAGFRSSQIGAAFRDSSAGYTSRGSASGDVSGRDYSGADVTGRDAYRNDALETPTSLDEPRLNEPSTGGTYTGTGTGNYASTTGRSGAAKAESYGHAAGAKAEGWWEKVKHFFVDDEDSTTTTERGDAAYGTTTTGPLATGTGGGSYAPGSDYSTTGQAAGSQYGAGQYGNDYEYDYNDADFGGSLTGVGLPQERARALASELGPGGAIVTVKAAGREQEAESILERNNGRVRHENIAGTRTGTGSTAFGTAAGTAATDYAVAQREPFAGREGTGIGSTGVGSTGVGSGVGSTARDYAAGESPTGDYAGRGERAGTDRVQLFGEVLRVHKERINRGDVVIRKEIVTENQNIQVPVTREEFVLDRVPVEGERPAPGARLGENQEIRIPLSGERVNVEKQPVVREEVVVGKREITDNEQVADQVQHEELRVDDSASKGVGRETGTRETETRESGTGESRVDDPGLRRPA